MLKSSHLKFLFIAFACVIFLASTRIALAQNKIIAVVNNEIITQKDLDDFVNFTYIQLSARYKDDELEDKFEELLPDLLNKLVEDRLILQEARVEDIFVDEARIKGRIAQIKSRYASDAEFQNALAAQGLTQADIESKIRDQQLIYNIIDLKIRSKILVSPKEVTEFYEQNSKDFLQPPTRRVIALILEKKGLINDVITSIESGLDFKNIASLYSIGLQDLGLVRKGQLLKEIEEAVFNLKAHGISNPVKLNDSYYIFKVEEILPVSKYDLHEVQDAIYNHLFELKMQERLTQWLDSLKEKSYVEIK